VLGVRKSGTHFAAKTPIMIISGRILKKITSRWKPPCELVCIVFYRGLKKVRRKGGQISI